MHVTVFPRGRYRARWRLSAKLLALAALLICAAGAACAAAEPPPAAAASGAPATQAKAPSDMAAARVTTVVKCTSVVIRNCRAQLVVDPAAAGTALAKGNAPPGRWEAVRNADPDSDEILVEEDRLRDPAVHDVFERYLGAGPDALITRNAAGGARCTTIASTGATFCSHPGTQAPTPSLPHSDFSDGVF